MKKVNAFEALFSILITVAIMAIAAALVLSFLTPSI